MSSPGSDRFRTGGALQGRLSAALLDPPPAFQPGTRLGVWRLDRLLGRGGMSEVYLATRTGASFEQTVALKIVAAGPELNERLREERRMLARLKHPGIAGLIDGGELEDGRAWFAMEFVEGLRLDEYVVTRQLAWSRRIEVFEALCAAVMHAHVHLLVHRDIKPANVIVDEQGRLRLLDFGIAVPAQEQREAADHYMTPGFAAPEQLEGGDITTATDIFQLGETLRRITLASADQATLVWPSPVRAGLEAIIARATAAAPSQRYDSVARLREDLEALRQFHPVHALGGGMGYRTGLLVRRHPRAAGMVVLLFLLAAVSAVSLWRSLAREAEERRMALSEEHTAGAIGNFFVELYQDPIPGEAGMAGVLDRAQQRLLAERGEAPQARAALLYALAMANVRMERPDTARPLLIEAIATLRELGATANAELALALASLASIDFLAGDSVTAMRGVAEAQALLDTGITTESHAYFQALLELGSLHVNAMEFASADSLLGRALALGVRRYGADSAQLYNVRRLQVNSLSNQSQAERALPLSEALVAECARIYGADDPTCIVEATHRARLQAWSGQLGRAEQEFRQLLAKSANWTGKWRSYRIHAALFDLAETLWLQGRWVEARTTFEKSLEKLTEAQGGSSGPHWDSDRGALATLLLDMGQAELALSISGARPWPGPGKPAIWQDHSWIIRQAPIEVAVGQIDARTAPALEAAVRAMRATYGENSYFAGSALLAQARVMFASGQAEAAQRALDAAIQSDQQGLRLHHAQLLAEIDLLRSQLAAKRGDQNQEKALQDAALAHLPAELFADDHPLRAAMQAQILLTRAGPLTASDRLRLEQSAQVLGAAQAADSPLLIAARQRLQRD